MQLQTYQNVCDIQFGDLFLSYSFLEMCDYTMFNVLPHTYNPWGPQVPPCYQRGYESVWG